LRDTWRGVIIAVGITGSRGGLISRGFSQIHQITLLLFLLVQPDNRVLLVLGVIDHFHKFGLLGGCLGGRLLVSPFADVGRLVCHYWLSRDLIGLLAALLVGMSYLFIEPRQQVTFHILFFLSPHPHVARIFCADFVEMAAFMVEHRTNVCPRLVFHLELPTELFQMVNMAVAVRFDLVEVLGVAFVCLDQVLRHSIKVEHLDSHLDACGVRLERCQHE